MENRNRTPLEVPLDCPNCKEAFYTRYHYSYQMCGRGSKLTNLR